jgi:cytochrome P450
VWLGYRVLFEEYFAEGYHGDLEQMREIVRERIRMWEGRESIDLLKEIYRIMIEIRARIFFQTTFDCFDDNAAIDYAGIVDRVLSPQVLLVNGNSNGEVEVLQQRVLQAVKGSKRKNSIGGIILDAWQAGDLNEREACENGVMYVLAQAPTMGVFWTLYRAARDGRTGRLRDSRKEVIKAIKEELRLHAPVTSMFRRQVLRDDRLGDLPVKNGDMIILCPMFIHTNDQQWTAPFQYNPERWTPATGDSKEIVEPKTDPADANARPVPVPEGEGTARYLPFGGGGQACQGRWFAADEMVIVVEEILKHYGLQVLDDQGLLGKPLPEQVTLHVYNRPANDVRMKPVRRR